MPLKVYIETTIPSAYHETRRDNRRLHLAIPLLITPLQLMKGET